MAVVTGASSGIGRTVAVELSRRGTTVIGWARRSQLVAEVAAECRATAPASDGLTVDVTDREAVDAAVAEVIGRFGRIDLLVNNAGISMRVHASRLKPEQVEEVMAVNFFGAVYATVAVLPSMLARGQGRVVNVASVAGRVASPREAAYTASKHALAGWSDALAADLAGTGVDVHLVCPGPIETEIWDSLEEPASYHGRFYPPEQVAAAVMSCLDRGHYERWVPGWMRMVPVVRSLAPRWYLRSAARFEARGTRRLGAGSGNT